MLGTKLLDTLEAELKFKVLVQKPGIREVELELLEGIV